MKGGMWEEIESIGDDEKELEKEVERVKAQLYLFEILLLVHIRKLQNCTGLEQRF